MKINADMKIVLDVEQSYGDVLECSGPLSKWCLQCVLLNKSTRQMAASYIRFDSHIVNSMESARHQIGIVAAICLV